MEEKVITPSSSEGIHLLDNCKLLFCRFSSVRHLSFGTIQVKHLTLFRALLFQIVVHGQKGKCSGFFAMEQTALGVSEAELYHMKWVHGEA